MPPFRAIKPDLGVRELSTHRPGALPLNMNKLGAQIQWRRIAPGTDNAFVSKARPSDCGLHWFGTFTGGISSWIYFFFFFPWHLEPISLPGSQPSTQREKVRETDGQAHKSIEWVPTKFDRNFAGRRRGKRIRKMSKFLSLLAVNIFAKYWQMNLSSV